MPPASRAAESDFDDPATIADYSAELNRLLTPVPNKETEAFKKAFVDDCWDLAFAAGGQADVPSNCGVSEEAVAAAAPPAKLPAGAGDQHNEKPPAVPQDGGQGSTWVQPGTGSAEVVSATASPAKLPSGAVEKASDKLPARSHGGGPDGGRVPRGALSSAAVAAASPLAKLPSGAGDQDNERPPAVPQDGGQGSTWVQPGAAASATSPAKLRTWTGKVVDGEPPPFPQPVGDLNPPEGFMTQQLVQVLREEGRLTTGQFVQLLGKNSKAGTTTASIACKPAIPTAGAAVPKGSGRAGPADSSRGPGACASAPNASQGTRAATAKVSGGLSAAASGAGAGTEAAASSGTLGPRAAAANVAQRTRAATAKVSAELSAAAPGAGGGTEAAAANPAWRSCAAAASTARRSRAATVEAGEGSSATTCKAGEGTGDAAAAGTPPTGWEGGIKATPKQSKLQNLIVCKLAEAVESIKLDHGDRLTAAAACPNFGPASKFFKINDGEDQPVMLVCGNRTGSSAGGKFGNWKRLWTRVDLLGAWAGKHTGTELVDFVGVGGSITFVFYINNVWRMDLARTVGV